MWKTFLVAGCFVLLSTMGFAQSDVVKIRHAWKSGAIIDSAGFLPGSLRIWNQRGEPLFPGSNEVDISFLNGTLAWEDSLMPLPLKLVYRPFPRQLLRSYSLTSTLPIGRKANSIERFRAPKGSRDPVLIPGLELNGYIQRGVSSGPLSTANTSELNLELSGTINGLKVSGVLADKTLPFQSDGGTAQVDEFDRVFFQVSNANHLIRLGDVVLNFADTSSYAGGYNRTYRGVKYKGENSQRSLEFTAGQVRGQFKRQVIPLFSGVLGPYRLFGNQNEASVIVIAGSERVFYNGKLLVAGVDYQINYQLGEIYFTESRTPFREDQLVVEYTYTSRNFMRLGTELQHETDLGSSGRIRAALFHETDLKNRPLLFAPDSADIALLKANAPPVINTRFNPIVGNREGLNLYVQTQDGDEAKYEYSSDSTQVRYACSFYFVGAAQGDYQVVSSNGNGPIYGFVGIGKGDFKVGKRLFSPEQMSWGFLNFRNDSLFEALEVESSLALSQQNLNTFQNQTQTGWYLQQRIGARFSDWTTMSGLLEVQGENYQSPNPVNFVEKSLMWGLEADAFVHQPYLISGLALEHNKGGQSVLVQPRVLKTDSLSKFGGENQWSVQDSLSQFTWDGNWFLENGLNGKQNIAYSRVFKQWDWGVFGMWKRQGQDSLLNPGGDFYRLGQRLVNQGEKGGFSAEYYFQRGSSSVAQTFHHLQTTWNRKNEGYQHQLSSFLRLGEQGEGRFKYSMGWNSPTGAISWNQELGAGSELFQTPSYKFVEVANGLGEYGYTDFNGNGEKEIQEFYLARYAGERNYIRLISPSVNYDLVRTSLFNEQVRWRPFRSENGKQYYVLGSYRDERSFVGDWELQKDNTELRLRRNRELFEIGRSMELGPYGKVFHQHSRNLNSNVNGWDSQVEFGKGGELGWAWKGVNTSLGVQRTEHYISSNYALERNFHFQTDAVSWAAFFQTSSGFNIGPEMAYREKQGLGFLTKLSEVGLNLAYLPMANDWLGSMSFSGRYVAIAGKEIDNLFLRNSVFEGYERGNNFQFQLNGTIKFNSYLDLNTDIGVRRLNDTWVGAGSLVLKAHF